MVRNHTAADSLQTDVAMFGHQWWVVTNGLLLKHNFQLCQPLFSFVCHFCTALRFVIVGVQGVRSEVQPWGVVWISALVPFTSTAPSRPVAPSTLITISLPARTTLTCTRQMIRLKGVLSCLLQLYSSGKHETL